MNGLLPRDVAEFIVNADREMGRGLSDRERPVVQEARAALAHYRAQDRAVPATNPVTGTQFLRFRTGGGRSL